MQLVAYGAQDIYLTGNPQITFFKVVYRRHTNFSMEDIAQDPSGSVDFGGEATYTIARNGDLVHKMYFEIEPSIFISSGNNPQNYSSCLGNTFLKETEIEIGGQKIDTHYSHWLTTWNNLTEPNERGSIGTYKPLGEPASVGGGEDSHNSSILSNLSFNHLGASVSEATFLSPKKAYVPLQFWFNRNPGLALPLIALQYHEVKLKTKFADFSELCNGAKAESSVNSKVSLYVQYIYLDTDERRRFAQVSHEYLIEQLQFQKESSTKTMFELNFNHPIKELIWTGEPDNAPDGSGKSPGVPKGLSNTSNTEDMWQLKLNGHDRFEPRNIHYFTRQQVYDYHTGYGGIIETESIAVYSFALKPEEHQPSGTCNFSRIDTAQLMKTSGDGEKIHIYAVNYNVLRIMSGMGGLAYSN